MYNAIPEINRHTASRTRQDNLFKHKVAIRSMKPSIDNALPTSMYHPIVKAKKEQMIEGKCAQTGLIRFDLFDSVTLNSFYISYILRSMQLNRERQQDFVGAHDSHPGWLRRKFPSALKRLYASHSSFSIGTHTDRKWLTQRSTPEVNRYKITELSSA